MNHKEIAATLRREIGELEAAIKKSTERCEHLKRFVLDLEEEIEAAEKKPAAPAENAKFRRMIDSVFGEKPKGKRG